MERRDDLARVHVSGITFDFEYGELWRGIHRRNPLSFKKPYSWIVYKDRDVYMAEDWRGRIRYEDDDAKEVIQTLFNTSIGLIAFLPAVYEISDTIYPRRTITLIGVGDYKAGVNEPTGVVLKATGDFPIFNVGGDGTYVENFKLFDLCLDGNDTASVLFKQSGGYRIHLISCELCRFTGYGIYQTGGGELQVHRCRLNSSKSTQADYGIYAGSDAILKANIIRGCKTGIRAGSGSLVEGNHPYAWELTLEVGIEAYSSATVVNNYIDNYSVCGIKGIDCHGVVIKNNRLATKGDLGTGDFPFILLDLSSAGTLYNVVITGNRGAPRSGTTVNEAISRGSNVTGFGGTCIIKDNSLEASAIGLLTVNSGVATFSGDGSTTTFNIEHGLLSTPSKYVVSPLTPDADASRTITVDDTYITITFDTAPPSGTDNVKFGWWAEV